MVKNRYIDNHFSSLVLWGKEASTRTDSDIPLKISLSKAPGKGQPLFVIYIKCSSALGKFSDDILEYLKYQFVTTGI